MNTEIRDKCKALFDKLMAEEISLKEFLKEIKKIEYPGWDNEEE